MENLAKENQKFWKKYMAGDRFMCDVVLVNLIALVAVFLSALLPVVSVSLPILVFMYFQTGVMGVICQSVAGEKCRYENLFVSFKKMIKIFCLFVVKFVLIGFWSCLLLIPGVVCFLKFAFTEIILFESSDLDVKSVLLLSKELTKGCRWKIFFFMLLALAFMCVVVSVMFCIILLVDLFLNVPRTFYLIFIILAAVLSFVLVALPMVEVVIADEYLTAKNKKVERKTQ